MVWHYLCSVDDVQADTGREFVIGDRVLAVFRKQQQWFALDGMCAHQGGPIAQGQLDGNCVTCPWHGWQYDITNGQNLLTGKQMLSCFQLEQRGQEIWIDL